MNMQLYKRLKHCNIQNESERNIAELETSCIYLTLDNIKTRVTVFLPIIKLTRTGVQEATKTQ